MRELEREVKEALEADGYEVERVGPTAGTLDGMEERSLSWTLGHYVLWLAVYVVARGGEELTDEWIRGALEKVKQTVRALRARGEAQAQETRGVKIWVPDGSGWKLVESEPLDDGSDGDA